jgi:hypothetical protein
MSTPDPDVASPEGVVVPSKRKGPSTCGAKPLIRLVAKASSQR